MTLLKEIMDWDQRNKRPAPEPTKSGVELVNKIDQEAMDSRSPESNKWTDRAEEMLDDNGVDNWSDLHDENESAIDDLIDYARDLKLIEGRGTLPFTQRDLERAFEQYMEQNYSEDQVSVDEAGKVLVRVSKAFRGGEFSDERGMMDYIQSEIRF